MDTHFTLDQALRATGELLARRGRSAAIVVVGGTALNLLHVVDRTTRDVDVIAVGILQGEGAPADIRPPDPLPNGLAEVVGTVARDLGLPADWMNTTVGGQWQTGMPPGFASRVSWGRHGALWVGLAGRIDLIYLKLYAAADDTSPASRHFADLLALRPTAEELEAARTWISQTQDASPTMAAILGKVISHVLAANS
jgi:hypothetical protein